MKVKILKIWKTHNKLVNKIEYPEPAMVRMGYGWNKNADNNKLVINSYNAIITCINKWETKKTWLNNNINTPAAYYYDKENNKVRSVTEYDVIEPKTFAENRLPIIQKLAGQRRWGEGMKLINTKKKFMNSLKNYEHKKYYELFFNYPNEYRVHVSLLGEVHAAQKIQWKKQKNKWCYDSRTIDFTSYFKIPKWWDKMIMECIKAIKLIKLDIGGFDIKGDNNDFTILEVNSAPSLSETSGNKYIVHIPRLLDFKYKQHDGRTCYKEN